MRLHWENECCQDANPISENSFEIIMYTTIVHSAMSHSENVCPPNENNIILSKWKRQGTKRKVLFVWSKPKKSVSK